MTLGCDGLGRTAGECSSFLRRTVWSIIMLQVPTMLGTHPVAGGSVECGRRRSRTGDWASVQKSHSVPCEKRR